MASLRAGATAATRAIDDRARFAQPWRVSMPLDRPAGPPHTRRRVGRSLLACATVALLAWGALPGAADEPSDERSQPDVLARPRLVGDPMGGRSRLERLGIDLGLFYDQLIEGKAEGGGANPDAAFGHSGSYDFFGLVDLEELAGWRGGRLRLHLQGQYDRSVNDDVGALSDPIDDADFDAPIYVAELRLGQSLLRDRVRLGVGYLQLQTLVDRNAFANSEDRQFLSTFLDNNGVVPLPVGLGAAVVVSPWPWLEIAGVVADADAGPRDPGFDTIFDGADSLSWFVEASLESPLATRGRPGHTRIGVFVDGRALTDFASGRIERGHVGAWLSFDQVLWRSDEPGWGRLGVFARAGYADPDVNATAWFWSLGFEHAGALPTRERDVFGFGVYQALGSSVYREVVDPEYDRETGIEIYYALRAFGWLILTPDLQVVVDPGATGANDTAVIGTLRTRIVF